MPALSSSDFRVASRCALLKPSAIREILKTTASPEIISFAGGLPLRRLFSGQKRFGAAADETLVVDGAAALQYGLTEGYGPLREWVCAHLAETVGLEASPAQVLLLNGSQQGLDLAGKGPARSRRHGAGGKSQLPRRPAGFRLL